MLLPLEIAVSVIKPFCHGLYEFISFETLAFECVILCSGFFGKLNDLFDHLLRALFVILVFGEFVVDVWHVGHGGWCPKARDT